MILPTKGISPQRALVTIGAQCLEVLILPRSVNSAFEALKQLRSSRNLREPISFDWFSLALGMLYSLGAVELSEEGLIVKVFYADN